MSDPQENDQEAPRDSSEAGVDGTETAPDETAPDETPSTQELDDPSTEKDPGEEPRGGSAGDDHADHEAVGIGVVGRPQVDPDAVGD